MVYGHIPYLQRIIILDLNVAYYDTISSEMEYWGGLISYPYLLLITYTHSQKGRSQACIHMPMLGNESQSHGCLCIAYST